MSLFGGFRGRVLTHGLILMTLMGAFVALGDRLFVDRWVARELEERRVRVNSAVSVYDAAGKVVSSSVDPPVGPPSAEVRARLAQGAEPVTGDGAVMVGMFREGVFTGVVVRRLPPPMVSYPGPPLSLVLFGLALCVGATLLASIPLSRMATRVEALAQTERQLLASVSHELRTPLARIRVVLELAADGDPAQVRSYLAEIAHDLTELETLVDDVLASARLAISADHPGSARLPMHWTRTNLDALVETSRARFERLHPGQALDVTTEAGAGDLECDPGLLHRAIDNLLDNAAKHAAGARVELRTRREGDGVSITVADEGPGMPPRAARRAFEPFFRGDSSRDRRTGGVGLGLSIVRTVAEAHGGRVALESAPGRGTRITISIPRGAAR